MAVYHITVVIILNAPQEQVRGLTFINNARDNMYDNIFVTVQGNKYTFEFEWQTPHILNEIEYEVILDLCQFFMIETFPLVNEDNAIDPLNWQPDPDMNDINIFDWTIDMTVELI